MEKDGGVIPEAARYEMDVTNVAPAERHTVESVADADPGIYPMDCHKVNHVMNGNSYPGGMLSAVVYTDAMDTDIFADLMAAAGLRGSDWGGHVAHGHILPSGCTFTPERPRWTVEIDTACTVSVPEPGV